jgi:CubicO group peptidase (beta-lactamase class C family)
VAGVAAVAGLAILLGGCNSTDDQRSTPAATPSSTRSGQALSSGIDQFVSSSVVYKPIRAVLVIQDGHTLAERYYRTSGAAFRDVESVTKSVMSTLVGIAIDEGDIRSVDETLADLLMAYSSTMRPAVARTTLRQVLTATGGFEGEVDQGAFGFARNKDWTRGVLDRAVRPPGRQFAYSNGGAHLLSAILEANTGMSVLAYARAKLFDPLGIPTRPAAEPGADLAAGQNLQAYRKAGFAWPVDPQGRNFGAGLIKLRPRDMARLGLLYLDGGRWKGRQVVPSTWVRDATRRQVEAGEPFEGYGYMWWTTTMGGDQAYVAWGYAGQMIEVVPARHLVVVVSSDVDQVGQTPTTLTPSVITTMVSSYIEPATQR